ncbi:hypothetical protein SNE40_000442 [Patella caerulea]
MRYYLIPILILECCLLVLSVPTNTVVKPAKKPAVQPYKETDPVVITQVILTPTTKARPPTTPVTTPVAPSKNKTWDKTKPHIYRPPNGKQSTISNITRS